MELASQWSEAPAAPCDKGAAGPAGPGAAGDVAHRRLQPRRWPGTPTPQAGSGRLTQRRRVGKVATLTLLDSVGEDTVSQDDASPPTCAQRSPSAPPARGGTRTLPSDEAAGKAHPVSPRRQAASGLAAAARPRRQVKVTPLSSVATTATPRPGARPGLRDADQEGAGAGETASRADRAKACTSCADLARRRALNAAAARDQAIAAWLAALGPREAELERGWQAKLTPLQFQVLRMKATEEVNSGPLLNWFAPGTYCCAGCGAAIYRHEHKIPTTCGWPAFKDSCPGALRRQPGEKVPEITCAGCGGHMGHVFKSDRYPPPHHERHCVNSASLRFAPAAAEAAGEAD